MGAGIKLTPERRRKLVRDPKTGRIVEWRGGWTKRKLKKKRNSVHGTRVHIAAEFRKDHRRAPRVGDVHRTRTTSGAYHRQADWYVYTPHGWRDTGSTRKPTAAAVRRICEGARPSKPRRKRKP